MFLLGGNVMVVQIWGADHGPWLQALHLIFGIGTLAAPLLAEPFLARKLQQNQGVRILLFLNVSSGAKVMTP